MVPTPDRPRPSADARAPRARVSPPPLPAARRAPAPIPAPAPKPVVVPEKPPYFKWAFVNPFNLSLLAGGLGAAALTLNPLLALAAVGFEAIWLVNHDNAILRKLVWDPRYEKLKLDAAAQARYARIQGLRQEERERVEEMAFLHLEIQRLAAQNPSLTGDLLRTELKKTDRLVDAFIDMAVTSARYEQYLRSVDIEALDDDRARLEARIAEGTAGEHHLDIAKKNLAIILKRQEKMKEIRRYLDVARGQLDLIENSFRLIADQIVTMQSPQQLTGQLNELLDGVEAIKQTTIEADTLFATLNS
jgi:hypothetical protein